MPTNVAGAMVVVVGAVVVVAGAVVVVVAGAVVDVEAVGGGAVVELVVSGAVDATPVALGCGAGLTGAEVGRGTAAFGDPELPQAETANAATAPMATSVAR